jgi:hypothetical protein
LFLGGLACLPWARLTYAVVYFFAFSLVSWGFIIWAGWISHFQGSRGGNDTRLHCLGTVAISGFVFHECCTLFVYCLFFGHGSFLSCTSVRGVGDTRYSLLPCHGCSGWLGLVASETIGCGVVFCLNSISWGSLAVFGRVLDRMLKMAYVFDFAFCVDIFGGSARTVLDTLYDASFLRTVITNRISLLFIFNSFSLRFDVAQNRCDSYITGLHQVFPCICPYRDGYLGTEMDSSPHTPAPLCFMMSLLASITSRRGECSLPLHR